jgi:hypothetical protein
MTKGTALFAEASFQVRPHVPDFLFSQMYLIRRCCRLDECQCDLGLKENGQHRKRNRAVAIAMEAIVEKLTPPRVLKQVQMLRG